MARYDDYEEENSRSVTRQKDLVLAANEFAYVMQKTNGIIKTYTGPIMVTISQQESLVIFNSKTKRFEETNDFEKARQIFSSAPEGWYITLKNPTKDNSHPDPAKAMNSPDMIIGKKINIAGPCSFSLYPGQMAKVVQGHRLRSNQYLIARVYDAEAAQESTGSVIDANGEEITINTEKYFVGQLLVIKGTEVSFYMPPTGIEVLAVDKIDGKEVYVRDAVTLERLEYAILKDEDGEKRYVHGPAVVFPKPTETFVESNKNGGVIFRALELSPISGIYVKVIADYKDEDSTEHKIGEELFITGNDQMIYYPRPEHAMIQYDGKYMHHAIAIPEGEGRYILNRLTGDIRTVTGPAMYLPDPRTEVVVKRKLSPTECDLIYPNNSEVYAYNMGLSETATEKLAKSGKINALNDVINCAYSTANATDSLAIFEATSNISRGVSYTKPRTITLDTKYDGVVTVNVWTGYAVCVVSKSGDREVIVGPATRLLDYDETLEPITLPDGSKTAYLPLNDNKITDIINAQTSDHVDVQIKLTYNLSFIAATADDAQLWFEVNDYATYIKDSIRNIVKREVRTHSIQDVYANSTDIIRNIILDNADGEHPFESNSSVVTDVEINTINVEKSIANMLFKHQEELLSKGLELADADAKMQVITALAAVEKQEADLNNANKLYKLELEQKYATEKMAKEEELRVKQRAADEAETTAKRDMQILLNAINAEELARKAAANEAEIAHARHLAEIEAEKQAAYAKMIEQMMKSISPDLIAALTTSANANLLAEGMKNMSPYALANGMPVPETVNLLLRGTPLEGMIDKMTSAKPNKKSN